jgi:hypothetical protein
LVDSAVDKIEYADAMPIGANRQFDTRIARQPRMWCSGLP